jgi:DNA repair protein RadA/Sms
LFTNPTAEVSYRYIAGGAVRPVAQAAARLKGAAKLGFARAVIPQSAAEGGGDLGLTLTPVASLSRLAADIAALGQAPDHRDPRQD